MTDQALTSSDRRRALIAIIVCMALVGLTIGLSYPLLSLILEMRGHSRTVIGLNAAMPAVAMLLLSPLLPRAIAATGVRRFLVLCAFGDALLLLALKAFDSLPAWFLLRFLLGLTGAGLFVAAETWVNEVADDSTRGRLLAIYAIAMNLGLASGPVILTVTGIEGWAPFMVAAAGNIAGAIVLMAIGGMVPRFDGAAAFSAWSFLRVAPTLSMAVFVFAFVETAGGALLAVYGVRSGYTADAAALMLTVILIGGIALQLPLGWLADRFNRYMLLGWAGALTAVSIALLPFLIDRPIALYSVLFIWGGLATGLYTLALAIQGQRFRGPDLVVANAAFGVLWGIGSLAGPAIAGVAMDIEDPHGLPIVMAAAGAVFVFTLFVRRRARLARSDSVAIE